jgi:hypothetical protein
MYKILKVFVIMIVFFSCKSSVKKPTSISTIDVENFWKAYDEFQKTNDSIQQIKYLNELFINKGTVGLQGIMIARKYTATSYREAILKHPEFWKTVRPKTLEINRYKNSIEKAVLQFKKIYPKAKPAAIYFTIGALRTGGTTIGNKVLIGSEIALADKTVNTSELEKEYPHLPKYIEKNNPKETLVFGNIHEYIHTQQDTTIANSLLSRTLIEGIAEFVAEKTLQISSPNEAIIFGKKNDEKIKNAFAKELFTDFEGMWFWGNANNQFQIGDLGYYIGYAISKSYFEKSENKEKAIQEMITLNYLDKTTLHQFVDKANYFEKSIAEYQKEIEQNRPKVIQIENFKNNSKDLNSSISKMTIEFSKSMNTKLMNLRLGPLGENNLLEVTNVIGWSKDHKKLTYEIALKSNLRQQLLITDIFRSKDGYLLAPYLIDITTK